MDEKVKNKPKKYFIVQYDRKTIRIFKTEEEYEEMIKIIKKNNSNPSSALLFSNVKKEYNEKGEIVATISVYAKIKDRSSLEDIDEETMNIRSMYEFLEIYGHLRRNNLYYPEILSFGARTYKDENGMQTKYDVGSHTDRLFFKNDRIYMNPKTPAYVINAASQENNIQFFTDLANSFSTYPNATDACISCKKAINFYKQNGFFTTRLWHEGKNIFENTVYKKKNNKFLIDENGKKILDYKPRRNFADFLSKCHQDGLIYIDEMAISEENQKLKR